MTQHERLLDMFSKKATWSNYELRSMIPAMFQYPARIHELKQKGYIIVTSTDTRDRKKFWYTLVKKGV